MDTSKCGCGDSHDEGVPTEPKASGAVVARVPQGFDTKITVRILPGRDFRLQPQRSACQPRQGARRRDAAPEALPPMLDGKLKDANAKLLEWLAKDAANARLFLADPIAALIRAGVQLTRAEQKALARAHDAAATSRVIPPGVNVTDFSATVDVRGRVGDRPGTAHPKPGHGGDCGCGAR